MPSCDILNIVQKGLSLLVLSLCQIQKGKRMILPRKKKSSWMWEGKQFSASAFGLAPPMVCSTSQRRAHAGCPLIRIYVKKPVLGNLKLLPDLTPAPPMHTKACRKKKKDLLSLAHIFLNRKLNKEQEVKKIVKARFKIVIKKSKSYLPKNTQLVIQISVLICLKIFFVFFQATKQLLISFIIHNSAHSLMKL